MKNKATPLGAMDHMANRGSVKAHGKRFWRRAMAGVAVSLSMGWAQSAFAASDAHDGEHSGGGMPQLNPDYFDEQIIWLAITFIALYVIMSRFALPKVGEVLEERQRKIDRDVDRANALKEEAEQVKCAYEQELTNARAQAQDQLRETNDNLTAQLREREEIQAVEDAKRIEEAESAIAAKRQEALSHVRGIAAGVAQAAVQKITGFDVTEEASGAAVDTVLKTQG